MLRCCCQAVAIAVKQSHPNIPLLPALSSSVRRKRKSPLLAVRSLKTAAQPVSVNTLTSSDGPEALYERRVKEGSLRADDFQRSVVKKLQKLHDKLENFVPPPIPDPVEYDGLVSLVYWDPKERDTD